MSPLPLGILASAGGITLPAYELISTTILGSNTSSITFSSVPQTYKHLQLRVVGKLSSSYTAFVRFNGVATLASYSSHRMYGDGSAAATQNQSGNGDLGTLLFAPESAGSHYAAIMDILDYSSTSKFKTTRTFNGGTGYSWVQLGSGAFLSTNAVTSITVRPDTGTDNFITGSRFSLYGIRG